MKILASWEVIQLFVESGEATGKTQLGSKHKLATNSMIYDFICTWHVAKIVIINVKMR
jgi:hypothetical protein